MEELELKPTQLQNDVGLGLELSFAISLSLNKLTVNNVTTFSTVSCSTHGAMGDTQNVKFFECKKHACEAISSSCKLSVLKVLDFLYLFIFLSVVGDCSTTLQWCKWCTHSLTSFTFLGSLKKGFSSCQHFGLHKQ